MAEFLSPGVFVQEVPGSRPVQGVGTSTAGFVGIAERGPTDEARLITNFTQYVETFGRHLEASYLTYAVEHFFAQGGTRCYVVRTGDAIAVASVGIGGDPNPMLTFIAKDAGTFGNGLSIRILGDSAVFDVRVMQGSDELELFEGLTGTNVEERVNGESLYVDVATGPQASLPQSHVDLGQIRVYALAPDVMVNVPRVAGNPPAAYDLQVLSEGSIAEVYDDLTLANSEVRINGQSSLIEVQYLGGSDLPTVTDPALAVEFFGLEGGSNGDASLDATDLLGDEAARTGLHALDSVDDVNIIAIPDAATTDSRTVTLGGYSYCESRGDCVYIADSLLGQDPQTVRDELRSGLNSSYAALYYPWIEVADPLSGGTKLVPPSGAVAGTYSSTDVRRGVHKAPAGTIDGRLNVAVGVERVVTVGEHDTLNPDGINVIRSFADAGIVLWGARTLSADAAYRYISVRRLMLFVAESLEEGTQYVVFEPNTPSLWGSVRRDVEAFLATVWRSGALFGATREEAYFVKVDEENNPPEARAAGELYIDVGIAPAKPAEFVVIRISQQTQAS